MQAQVYYSSYCKTRKKFVVRSLVIEVMEKMVLLEIQHFASEKCSKGLETHVEIVAQALVGVFILNNISVKIKYMLSLIP